MVDGCPFWAWLEVPVAIGLGVFGDDHPGIVLLEVGCQLSRMTYVVIRGSCQCCDDDAL